MPPLETFERDQDTTLDRIAEGHCSSKKRDLISERDRSTEKHGYDISRTIGIKSGQSRRYRLDRRLNYYLSLPSGDGVLAQETSVVQFHRLDLLRGK